MGSMYGSFGKSATGKLEQIRGIWEYFPYRALQSRPLIYNYLINGEDYIEKFDRPCGNDSYW